MVKWFDIKGYEGRYQCTADGCHVRSCPRRWWAGSSLRQTKGKMIAESKLGGFLLANAFGHRKLLRSEDLIALIGKEVEA